MTNATLLRAYMHQTSTSQRQLAKAAKVSRSRIQAILKGYDPPASELERLLRAIETNAASDTIET